MTAAGYLAWVSWSGGSVVGCGPSSGCDQVLQSRWAYWLGIPVSVPALGMYVALLAATFGIDDSGRPNRQRWMWWFIITASVTVAGAALWFVGLQVFLLKSFCKFCLAAHSCGFIGTAILLRNAPIRSAPASGLPIGVRSATACGAAGILGVLVLALGQLLVESRQYQVSSTGGTSATTPRNVGRQLAIHNGLFQLPLDQLPMFGSPDAPQVVVSLFDYTCPHCRVMHGVWMETQRRYGAQLAVVSLPVPMSANCNQRFTRTLPAHLYACDYARLGLAVWRAKRSAFAQFDSWMFTPSTPPPVAEVKRYAEELVGRENLNLALQDDWINRQLRTNTAIYTQNEVLMKTLKMPQAIIGSAIVIGSITKSQDLDRLLERELGLKLQQ